MGSRRAEVEAALGLAVTAALSRTEGPVWLPDVLTTACAGVLPVDGAGVSFRSGRDRRLPVGAADQASGTAERLQFALGDGPCFAAERTQQPVCTAVDDGDQRWPVYWTEMVERTPYRSVVALPVAGPLSTLVAVSLFFVEPGAAASVDPDDVAVVADVVGRLLVRDLTGGEDLVLGRPVWLDSPAVRRRQEVWRAVGVLNAERGTSSEVSLAVLRGHAFVQAVDLEVAAARVLAGDLPAG